ncbi:hypothetical protein KR084_010814 [Drosophila pseudotakahashii]|nr:hypothetical protein KR084_010814 [Drosophila pseudotakahashii]
MPFGLCKATQTMSRLMDKVIPPQLRNEVFVYLDNLLIVSDTLERHLEVFREVAFHIKRAGVTINIGKSKFGSKRVKYLGLILDSLEDRSLNLVQKDSLEIVRRRAGEIRQQQFENNKRQYNLRARVVNFAEGQEVFRRNFKQSNFAEGYNAKLGPRFLKARVRKKLGEAYYALEDMQGKSLGKNHAKHIRQ